MMAKRIHPEGLGIHGVTTKQNKRGTQRSGFQNFVRKDSHVQGNIVLFLVTGPRPDHLSLK